MRVSDFVRAMSVQPVSHRAFCSIAIAVMLVCGLLPASLLAQSATQSLDERLTEQWSGVVVPSLKEHCGECHLGGANEGGVNLDDYGDLAKIREHASTWEQIRGVIRAEAMPPPESSKMDATARATIANWIQSALHDVDCDCVLSAPPVTVRRLNQYEYDNTIQDLLGIELQPSKVIGFVSDDVGNGFDNQGEVLTIAPLMLEKYLQAAILISESTIATNRDKLRNQRFDGEQFAFSKSQTVTPYLAPGKYKLNLRMRFGDDQKDNCTVVFKHNGQTLTQWEVAPQDKNYDFQFDVQAKGDQVIQLEYSNDADEASRSAPNRRVIVDNIRISGPESGPPAFPKCHELLVIATPEQKDTPESQPIGFSEACRRVFQSFLPRAYRREVTDDEVQTVVIVCEKAHEAGYNFEESVRFGLQAVLVSPSFLFRTEQFIVDSSGQFQTLDHYSIATRLSYFLWSTMPDETLLQLAKEKKLHSPDVIKEQIARMIEHPKSTALLKSFFAQWLGLRNLNKLDLDKEKYPAWSDKLRAAMIKETELFCRQVLLSGTINDFTTAKFTFINPRLAEFYGMTFEGKDPSEMYRRRPLRRGGNDPRRLGAYDDEEKWIQVETPPNRQGLLTHAAVLALTSNPTRTSPVKRGKWILENVLGDPPPSAPPNVPTLEQASHAEGASLRERLEIHRSNPSCAGCHKLMDPIGLGLENFDATGRWREKDGNLPVDPTGELADGRKFSGPTELVALLSDKEDLILENFAGRMLTYAIGRGLQRQDRCDLTKITQHAKASSKSLRSIVEAIVLSDAFLQKSPIQPTVTQTEN